MYIYIYILVFSYKLSYIKLLIVKSCITFIFLNNVFKTFYEIFYLVKKLKLKINILVIIIAYFINNNNNNIYLNKYINR